MKRVRRQDHQTLGNNPDNIKKCVWIVREEITLFS
jgi:hypothetical protein